MKSVENWVPQKNGPKFRSWLFTIARNHLINERKKQLRESPVGGITALTDLQLIQQASSDSHDESVAYRKEAILFAASRVRSQMESKTWQAFWKTTIESQSCQLVAQELKMGVASVYAARSRTLRKIREQIQLMLECDHEV
jgi:RNA polymerase sigma-70 factor (ECF subfamily)